MNAPMKATTQLPRRRGEEGQSIIVLAIAFFALAAFVGIVTDVSLMLVRYSTLRRAVDSASVAAATQMRQGTDFATVGLAARQFVEFYGLSPLDVLVNTCDSYEFPAVEDPDLCGDERFFTKQVRVTAQVESPTVFLRLVGWENVTLQASAISTTAALDVVIVMDVSESMLNETSYVDWASIDLGRAYRPPRVTEVAAAEGFTGAGIVPFWQNELLGFSQGEVNDRLKYSDDDAGDGAAKPAYEVIDFVPASVTAAGYDIADQGHPSEDCRVRFFPYSISNTVPNDLRNEYQATAKGWNAGFQPPDRWDGFIPTYDFYGCCNDPTSGGIIDDDANVIPGVPGKDYDFSDLICQPFKQARDATRQFIQRLDFPRDRVAYVTFDRTAYIINPYTRPDGNESGFDHMIFTYEDAVLTLNRHVGVRAEPNFYRWVVDESTGSEGNAGLSGWAGFASGITADDVTCNSFGLDAPCSIPLDYDAPSASLEDAVRYNYPVYGNCAFQNSSLPFPYTLYQFGGGSTLPVLDNIMLPDPKAAGWKDLNPVLSGINSYELWSSCRGTNIGSGLREAYGALNNNLRPRTSGAVWIVILLSDGAAGASDPVRRGNDLPIAGDPYITPNTNGAGFYGLRQANGYGAYGLCPFGDLSAARSQNIDTLPPPACKDGNGQCGTQAELVDTTEALFPFCSDEEPRTRHRCDFVWDRIVTDPGHPDVGRSRDVDLDNCESLYDVDDYARDWADAIGLVDETQTGEIFLPTLFTIGFGLEFRNTANPESTDWRSACAANIPDCLGEELLRYIADVGDNFRMDNDYWQDWLEDDNPTVRQIEGFVTEGFGPRGACQATDVGPNFDAGLGTSVYTDFEEMYKPLPATVSCGNYFNAPDQDELELVFDEIASRMFTRLSR